MNYGKSLAVLAICGLSACAPHEHAAEQTVAKKANLEVEGPSLGTFRDQEYAEYTVEKAFLTIDGKSVTRTKVCRVNGKKHEVTYTSPARVSGSHYEVLVGGENVEMIGLFPCRAELRAGVIAYEIKNNHELYLSIENGPTYFFGYRLGQPYTRTGRAWSALKSLDPIKAIPAAVKAYNRSLPQRPKDEVPHVDHTGD